jgi:hypothetical protein
MNTPRTTKKILKTMIDEAKAARIDRSIPCLLGEGYTIAEKGRASCLTSHGKMWKFIGCWSSAIYWNRANAEKVLAKIAPQLPFEAEIIHYNEARDRMEHIALGAIKLMWPKRHAA